MDYYNQIYIILFLILCFGIYKLYMRASRKRNARPMYLPEDETDLKDILSRIYSSANLENLQSIFAEGFRSLPRYHDLLNVAIEEKSREITQNTSTLSFEARESKTRKTWLLALFLTQSIKWLLGVISILFMDSPEEGPWTRLAAVISITVFISLIIWMFYHCAYKKKGTGLLLWMLFSIPGQTLTDYIKEGNTFSMWDLPGLFLLGFFWISCLHLRRINCEAKARKQLTCLKAVMI